MLSRRWMRGSLRRTAPATEMTSTLARQRDRLGLDRVGDEEPLDRAGFEPFDRGLGEQAVAHHRVDLRGAAVGRDPGGVGERAGGDREVVDDHRGLALRRRPMRSSDVARLRSGRCAPCRRSRSGTFSRSAYSRACLAKPASGATTTRSGEVLGDDRVAQDRHARRGRRPARGRSPGPAGRGDPSSRRGRRRPPRWRRRRPAPGSTPAARPSCRPWRS